MGYQLHQSGSEEGIGVKKETPKNPLILENVNEKLLLLLNAFDQQGASLDWSGHMWTACTW